jgi:S-formylglutathione hydrolase FrmB
MRRLSTWVAVVLALAAPACGGDDAADVPDGLRVEAMTVASRAVDRDMPVKVVLPEGEARDRPLLVFLHGRGNDESSSLRDPLFDALEQLGPDAPVVAFPDGADDKYWHDRASGDWGTYVVDEVIPQVARRFGADARRVAIGGISMGGFGALHLARLHPDRFCAAGGHSPALWRTSGETAPGAFDDAEDFARHDVVASAPALRGVRLWMDTGDADPFRPGIDAFAAALRAAGARATIHVWPGGHDRDYWDAHWPAYLRFYARALADC